MLIRENDCKGKPSKSCKEMMIMKGKANSEDWEKTRKTKEPTMKESKDGRNSEYVNVF